MHRFNQKKKIAIITGGCGLFGNVQIKAAKDLLVDEILDREPVSFVRKKNVFTVYHPKI